MNELLQLANGLVNERDESECEGYRCHLRSDFEKVIKDYQDLIRRMAILLNALSVNVFNNRCPEDDSLLAAANEIWVEVTESIPVDVQ